MFFARRKTRKILLNIIINNVRKYYKSDTKAITEFDKLVDTYLAIYFVAVCKTFGVKPETVNTVEELLAAIYEKLNSLKVPEFKDITTVEWLNTRVFPMLCHLANFNIVKTSEEHFATIEYLQLLISNTASSPINKQYSRSSLIMTSDYFINVMKSLVTEDSDASSATPFATGDKSNIIH